jgi:hypothetical protein
MKRSIPHAHGTGLIRCVVSALLVMLLHGTATAEPSARVWIDTGAILPYSFCRATISGPEGLSGFARLYGIAPDGSRTALFEARFGRLESLEALFYADPRFLWLGFEGKDGKGADLAASVRLGPRPPDAMQSSDTDAPTLAALPFPYRVQPFRGPPSEFTLSDASPEALARAAVSRLFSPRKSAWPLAVLSAWSLLAIGLAARGRRDALAVAVFIAGSALATAALSAAGGVTPELYSIAVRNQGSALVRSVRHGGAYDEVTWRDKAAVDDGGAGLRFLAFRSPLAAAIPVSALAPYRRIRFAQPPLVLHRLDGAPVLGPARYSAAWGFHD